MQTTGPTQLASIRLDPVSLILNASGPVFLVVWSLIAAAAVVWVVTFLKLFQLGRLAKAERQFEVEAARAVTPDQLFLLARRSGDSPGGRVILALARRSGSPMLLEAVAKRAIVTEAQRAGALLTVLSTIASAGPFVGLFGTVYGIMDAFLRIGQEKSASLPVVAPAIGEALIATAIGLFAAIPAVVAYNAINKRVDDLMGELEASSEGWVAIITGESGALPLRSASPPNTY